MTDWPAALKPEGEALESAAYLFADYDQLEAKRAAPAEAELSAARAALVEKVRRLMAHASLRSEKTPNEWHYNRADALLSEEGV